MTSCRRPKECEISVYRHGCDPPNQFRPASSSELKHQRPTAPASKQSLIRLVQLQPSPCWIQPFNFIQSNESED
jgi:hypothetical protein